jgi:SAM-dependent methyltransferase
MIFRHKKHKVYRQEAVEKLIRNLSRGRLLDAPCGDGTISRLAQSLGYEVWGCDIQPIVPPKGIRFQVADLNQSLPYIGGRFDVVLSIEGIEHLEQPARCIQEFARVLKPGGVLVLSTPNINNVQSRLHFLLSGHFSGFKTLTRRALEPRKEYPHWHITLPYLPTLLYLLTQNGFELDGIEVTMIKPKQWLMTPLGSLLWLGARKGSGVGKQLGSWKLLLGRSVIIRATKRSAPSSHSV